MNLESLTILGYHFIGEGPLSTEIDTRIENLGHRLRGKVNVELPIIGFSSDYDSMRTAICLGAKFKSGAQHWNQLDHPDQKPIELDLLLSEVSRRQKPEEKHIILVVEPLCIPRLVSFFADRLGILFSQESWPTREGSAVSLVPVRQEVLVFEGPKKQTLSLATA